MFTAKKLAVAAPLLGLLPLIASAQSEPAVAQLVPPPVCFPQATPQTPIAVPSPMPRRATPRDTAAIEARVLLQLAESAEEDGKITDAIDIYKQVLSISANNPQTSLDVAVSSGRLGAIYADTHKFPLALKYAQNALRAFEKIEGPVNNDVAIELNNLAWIYEQSRHRPLAEKTYLQAIAVLKASSDENDDLIAVAHNNLGDLYTMQHRDQQACKQYETAYYCAKRFFGADHPLSRLIAGKLHRSKMTLPHRNKIITAAAAAHKVQK